MVIWAVYNKVGCCKNILTTSIHRRFTIMKFLSLFMVILVTESNPQFCKRSSRPDAFCEKVFLEISQNLQENTCARVSFLIKLQSPPATLFKKKTLAQVFSREFCEISKNTFFYRTPLVAASVVSNFNPSQKQLLQVFCEKRCS